LVFSADVIDFFSDFLLATVLLSAVKIFFSSTETDLLEFLFEALYFSL